MTCPNRDRTSPSVCALVLVLGCCSACNDSSEGAASASKAVENLSVQNPPKELALPAKGARKLGIPRSETGKVTTVIRPVPLPRPSDIPASERFVPSSGRPAAVANALAANPGLTAKPSDSGFLGKPEAALLESLRSGQLQSAVKGSGRSLGFKVVLDSGTQGTFEPQQRSAGSNWSAEVAAFHLDRALQIRRVPPVVSRSFAWKQLAPAAADDARKRSVVVGSNGNVRGALSAWQPDKLVPLETPPGWENWLRNELWNPLEVTPYQPAASYRQALVEQNRRRNGGSATVTGTQPPPEVADPELPAALSDMMVFDYLTGNAERFEDDHANLLLLGDKGPLIFLENDAGFSSSLTPAQHGLLDARLGAVSKFRRGTIDALRSLDIAALKATMAADPLGPILDAATWRAFEARRDAVLEHVARQEKRFGDAVYAW